MGEKKIAKWYIRGIISTLLLGVLFLFGKMFYDAGSLWLYLLLIFLFPSFIFALLFSDGVITYENGKFKCQ